MAARGALFALILIIVYNKLWIQVTLRLDGNQQNNNLSNLWNPNMCDQWMNILRKKGIFEIDERLRSNFVSKKDGSSYLILILLLCDDIELNPGPVLKLRFMQKENKMLRQSYQWETDYYAMTV